MEILLIFFRVVESLSVDHLKSKRIPADAADFRGIQKKKYFTILRQPALSLFVLRFFKGLFPAAPRFLYVSGNPRLQTLP